MLVELLVVVGIISVLIAILLPALSRARIAALRVKCMNNHRQVMLAFLQYCTDNNSCMPPQYCDDSQPSPGTYPRYANRYLGQYIVNTKTSTTYNDSVICLCPALTSKPNVEGLGIGMNACWDCGMLRTTPGGDPKGEILKGT